MNRFTAQLLGLAIADFPVALLPAGGAGELCAIASGLAPWKPLYFECRLSGGGAGVDVSQHFHALSDGAEGLQALSRRQLEQVGDDAARVWRRIVELAGSWKDRPGLAEAMTEACLEYDAEPSGSWNAIPALFARFRSGPLADRDMAALFVATVLPEGSAALDSMLTTLRAAERHGLSGDRMMGVMLSRGAELRCMIGGLEPVRVRRLLDEIGWPGSIPALLKLLSEPALRGADVLLVLGHGPKVMAGCGLEIIYGANEAKSAERAVHLAWLVAHGLADPARVRALDDWGGDLTPINARANWPDALIAKALVESPSRLQYARRFVNHLKLNILDGEVIAAKAYLALAPVDWSMEAAAHV